MTNTSKSSKAALPSQSRAKPQSSALASLFCTFQRGTSTDSQLLKANRQRLRSVRILRANSKNCSLDPVHQLVPFIFYHPQFKLKVPDRFFRDLFQAGKPGFLLAMRAFFDGDTYIALPGNVKTIDQVFTTLVGGSAKAIVASKPAKFEREFGNSDRRGQGKKGEEQSAAGKSSETRKGL
ncbi:hypothetical protein MMC07_006502 [Pseudocyphellaria aurata]|nr:hypothetical protein [Pseudocyphellaria aurata]